MRLVGDDAVCRDGRWMRDYGVKRGSWVLNLNDEGRLETRVLLPPSRGNLLPTVVVPPVSAPDETCQPTRPGAA